MTTSPLSPSTSTPPMLLVIGGGLAGCTAIVSFRKYDKTTPIVLIEPKDFSELFWASYRSPFEEWVAKGSTIPLEPWCTKYNVTHIRTTVKKLTKIHAVMDNGETIDYTVCLVATGADYRGDTKLFGRGVTADVPLTREARLTTVHHEGHALLTKSTSILIVGGGLIGTELGGDLAVYGQKKTDKRIPPPTITIVHSGPYLAHENLTKAGAAMLHSKLTKLGVKVILNEKCIEKDGTMVLTHSGETVVADRVIYTVGLIPINSFLVVGDFPNALTDKGWVDTDEYFRVKNGSDGNSNGRLFALGDCCTTLANSGAKVIEQLPVIGKNLKATLDAVVAQTIVTDQDLKKAVVTAPMTINTVGPNDGVFQTPWFHTQMFVPWVKNKTMLFSAASVIYK